MLASLSKPRPPGAPAYRCPHHVSAAGRDLDDVHAALGGRGAKLAGAFGLAAMRQQWPPGGGDRRSGCDDRRGRGTAHAAASPAPPGGGRPGPARRRHRLDAFSCRACRHRLAACDPAGSPTCPHDDVGRTGARGQTAVTAPRCGQPAPSPAGVPVEVPPARPGAAPTGGATPARPPTPSAASRPRHPSPRLRPAPGPATQAGPRLRAADHAHRIALCPGRRATRSRSAAV